MTDLTRAAGEIRDNIDMYEFTSISPANTVTKVFLLTPRLMPSSSSKSSDPMSDIFR